jgi:hypothetical protein
VRNGNISDYLRPVIFFDVKKKASTYGGALCSVLYTKDYLDNKVKKNEIVRHVASMGQK